MSENHAIVLAYVTSHPGVTAKEIADGTCLSDESARQAADALYVRRLVRRDSSPRRFAAPRYSIEAPR